MAKPLVYNATLVERPKFGLTAGLNVSTNNSKVLSLGGAPSFTVGNYGWVVEGKPAPVLRISTACARATL